MSFLTFCFIGINENALKKKKKSKQQDDDSKLWYFFSCSDLI